VRLADTDTAALAVYADAFLRLTGPERVARAVEMAEEAKLVSLAGLRSRHPELSDDELATEWLRLLHGDDVVGVWLRVRGAGDGAVPD
jgi:hypothetical protein